MARKIPYEQPSQRRAPAGRGLRTPAPGDSPFAILGVSRRASFAEVKQAYRRLAALHHPDVANRYRDTGESGVPRAEECSFHEVQQAYLALQDRYARARWEREEEERERWTRQDDAHGDGDGGDLATEEIPETEDTEDSRERQAASGAGGTKGGHPPPAAPATMAAIARFVAVCRLKAPPGAWNWRLLIVGTPVLIAWILPLWREGRPARHGSAASAEVTRGAAAREQASNARLRTASREEPGKAPRERRAPLRQPAARPDISESRPGDASYPRNCAYGCEITSADRNFVPATNSRDAESRPPTAKEGEEATQPPPGEPRVTGDADFVEGAHPRAQAWMDEWRGNWVAYCAGSGAANLYRASLELGEDARFSWVNLATGQSGEIVAFETSAPDIVRNIALSRGPRATDASPPDGNPSSARPRATLVRDERQRRLLRWSEAARARRETAALPCAEWWIAPRAGPNASIDSRLDGVWVLPPNEPATEGNFPAEYAELRVARRGSRLDGEFVGRYAVPVAGMAREMRFEFQAPGAGGWHQWKNRDGAEGEVLFEPLGPVRLAVIWRRRTIPDGHPQLSAGAQVLSRMD